jgi:hypothetical protein
MIKTLIKYMSNQENSVGQNGEILENDDLTTQNWKDALKDRMSGANPYSSIDNIK